MQTGAISSRQNTCRIILFIFGNSALFGVNGSAGRDSWISLLIAGLCALLVTMMYAKIISLSGAHSFYEWLDTLFGKWIGKIVAVLFIWYAIHLAALLLRTLTEFGHLDKTPDPPRYLVFVLFTVAGIYLARSEGSVFGRWAYIIFLIVLAIQILTLFPAVKDMDILNLMPVMRRQPQDIAFGALRYLAFPFLESVIFIPLLCGNFQDGVVAKVFRNAILWSAGILLVILLTNLLLLGEPMLEELYFPTHSATKLISMGTFLTRVEEVTSIFMLFSGIAKFAVCLQVAAMGFRHLCGSISDFVIPSAMLSFALSMVVVHTLMDLDRLIGVYPAYAAIFQLLLPATILVAAMLHNRTAKRCRAAQG